VHDKGCVSPNDFHKALKVVPALEAFADLMQHDVHEFFQALNEQLHTELKRIECMVSSHLYNTPQRNHRTQCTPCKVAIEHHVHHAM
jgi:ubiquitin C-terminal hydrolase